MLSVPASYVNWPAKFGAMTHDCPQAPLGRCLQYKVVRQEAAQEPLLFIVGGPDIVQVGLGRVWEGIALGIVLVEGGTAGRDQACHYHAEICSKPWSMHPTSPLPMIWWSST